MEVGTQDLTLEVRSHLDKDDALIVEQLMTNSAVRLADFKCRLLARGHRPQRMQVYRLGPNVDRRVYRFSEGHTLVGKDMLLELEELNGPRILQYRFVAEAGSDDDEPASANKATPESTPPTKDTAKRPPLANVGS
jgi:hypothetical protein